MASDGVVVGGWSGGPPQLMDNIAAAMQGVPVEIIRRQVAHFFRADPNYGIGVATRTECARPASGAYWSGHSRAGPSSELVTRYAPCESKSRLVTGP